MNQSLNKKENILNVEEKATDNSSWIEDAIYSYPLSLLKITDDKVIKSINNLLPYSIGMEFECAMKSTYSQEAFEAIEDIMDVQVDPSEQRYRIPPGLKGMICLFKICRTLKENSILELGSSNHYHFDMTDIRDLVDNLSYEEKDHLILPVIESLKTWGTAVDYTMCNSWYRWNSLGTLELRIGEPSFDYDVIVKRLIQGSLITKKLKIAITTGEDATKVERLERELAELKEKVRTTDQEEEISEIQKIINSRNIKINE